VHIIQLKRLSNFEAREHILQQCHQATEPPW